MFFMADPEGAKEDDGVLETIVFDGEKEQSYLLLIDASSFEINNFSSTSIVRIFLEY